jgi:hypothetical protein
MVAAHSVHEAERRSSAKHREQRMSEIVVDDNTVDRAGEVGAPNASVTEQTRARWPTIRLPVIEVDIIVVAAPR